MSPSSKNREGRDVRAHLASRHVPVPSRDFVRRRLSEFKHQFREPGILDAGTVVRGNTFPHALSEIPNRE